MEELLRESAKSESSAASASAASKVAAAHGFVSCAAALPSALGTGLLKAVQKRRFHLWPLPVDAALAPSELRPPTGAGTGQLGGASGRCAERLAAPSSALVSCTGAAVAPTPPCPGLALP